MNFLSQQGAFLGVCFVLGLVLGSFLNVVILRLPTMLDRRWRTQCRELLYPDAPISQNEAPFNLATPGSRCGHCGHAIRAWENIPVLSFLLLRGKCSACRKPISWRYPAVELLSGLLSLAVAWRFGVSYATAAALLFTWAMIALTFIDYDTQLLPDDITMPLLWGGLLVNLSGLFAPLPSAVVGTMVGYVFLWFVYHGFKLLTGKEGMGFGDFKLFAAIGAWLGWQPLLLVLLLSSFFGAIVGLLAIVVLGRDRRLPIPFGPFLCGAGWVALMWGDMLTSWYWNFAKF